MTAEIVYLDENVRDAQFDALQDDQSHDHLNAILTAYMSLNGLPSAVSEYIGVPPFAGVYYSPSASPTTTAVPSAMPTTEVPTEMPSVAEGTDITIVIDGVDPEDEDLPDTITNITDTITGENTTVVLITPNPDGTVTVVVECLTCDPNDDHDAEIETELGEALEAEIVSVNTGSGSAKNGESVSMVMTTGEEWMIVALMCASALFLVLCFMNRKKVMGCVACEQKEEIIEIDGVIARPNTITEQWDDNFDRKVLPHIASDSSVWTQYTGIVIDDNGVREGNETFGANFEGDETMVAPMTDGYHETGGAEYQEQDGFVTGSTQYGHDGYATGGAVVEADGYETCKLEPDKTVLSLAVSQQFVAPQGYAMPQGLTSPMVGETYTSRFDVRVNMESPTAEASYQFGGGAHSPSMSSAKSFDGTLNPSFSPMVTPRSYNDTKLEEMYQFSAEEDNEKRGPDSQRSSMVERNYNKKRLLKSVSSMWRDTNNGHE